MHVIKSNGRKEKFDLNKFHKMVDEACKDLNGVSPSQVEINSNIQFYDGITTKEIQSILIRSASDLITLETPNYQFVAARLLLFSLYKEVYQQFDPIHIRELTKRNIKAGVYDEEILSYYTKEEWDEINSYVKHKRDFDFSYAGIQQLVDKYLVQNRTTGKIYETPQMAFMLIAAITFHKYPKETRLSYVKRFYDGASSLKINIPTPILAGVRTPSKQYASCVLIDVGDSIDSIFASNSAIGKYTASRAGIGLNVGRIRAINSKIRGGEVVHTGLVPFLKVFEATTKSCQQNGIRGGSATVFCPIWHMEIENYIVLKNNKGSEDSRVRRLDYTVQISKLFYERFLKGEMITLFSPHEVTDLYEAFGTPAFDELYVKYENDPNVNKKQVNAKELIGDIIKERAETGRVYVMNIDHANQNGPFLEKIYQSNLCEEILLPTRPIDDLNDTKGQIATCILAAINVGRISSLDELALLCDIIVRFLDELIDYQGYPVPAAEKYTKDYRTLGIGFIGLAHFLAKKKLKYYDKEAAVAVHELSEAFAYYLTSASVDLAAEKGRAPAFDRSKYSKGILPIDYYKRDVDTIADFKLHYDWEALRAKIAEHGMRNMTLMAQMPSESSSTVSNSTNGIEPPRSLLAVKKSKKGTLKQIVPGFSLLKNNYTMLWEIEDNKSVLNIIAVMQKFFDQTISTNTNYNPSKYPNNQVPMSMMIGDILYAFKMGVKTLYYHNTKDGKEDESIKEVTIDALVENLKEVDLEQFETEDEEMCEACAI